MDWFEQPAEHGCAPAKTRGLGTSPAEDMPAAAMTAARHEKE